VLSPYAPRILRIKINPEKIGALIGPGGKNIRGITEKTGTKIDVDDDGTVLVASTDGESAKAAIRMIEGLTKEAEVGEIYLGKVVRILPYGAFVEILPGKDGLVHISELADYRVENVEDVVALGDEINVMVIDVDRQGKVSLSRKAVLTGEMPAPRAERERSGGGGRGFGGGGDRDRGGYGGGGGGGRGYGDRDRGPGGPPRGGGYGDRDRGPGGPPRGGGYGDRDRGPAGPPSGGPSGERGSGYGGGPRGGYGGGERGPAGPAGPRESGDGNRDRGPREGGDRSGNRW
jgi:polyribonucleotide nucleotidyltransferase